MYVFRITDTYSSCVHPPLSLAQVQDVAGIVERLLGFLELGRQHVTAETLIQVKDLLRRYPDVAEAALAAVSSISPADVVEPEARAAFIWILGQHGGNIQVGPRLILGFTLSVHLSSSVGMILL